MFLFRVACGDLHTACLTDRGILMTFGSGSNGCLGHGSFQDVDKVWFLAVFLIILKLLSRLFELLQVILLKAKFTLVKIRVCFALMNSNSKP